MALTQKEIEDLINSMMTQNPDKEEAQIAKSRLRVYDFKRPDKFSKDHLRGAQLLFDNFSRLVTSYFSGLFRLAIHSNVASIDQITYEEFSGQLSNPCSVAVIQWASLSSNLLVNFSPQIALPMVDRLCGGPGSVTAVSRTLTEIETSVLTRVAEAMTEILSVTLKEFRIAQHMLSVSSIEVNPLFIQQAMAPNDIVLSVIMTVKFGTQTGDIEFCLPYTLLEPILPTLSAHRWFSKKDEKHNSGDSQDVCSAIQNVQIPISCVLGENQLSVADVLSLKAGDVVELNVRKDAPVTLNILGKPKFYAQVGRRGTRLAARIVSRTAEERS